MYDDAESLEFEARGIFREWLQSNHDKSEGIWIVFQKGNKTFTANDALEEAICFGWIDGLIKSIDERTYRKYFTTRKSTSKWSDKNIGIYNSLKSQGRLTEAGIKAFRGTEKKILPADRNEQNLRNIDVLTGILKNDNEIFRLFRETSPSRQKQLAGFYCDARKEETRKKRLRKITEALKANYKGMLY